MNKETENLLRKENNHQYWALYIGKREKGTIDQNGILEKGFPHIISGSEEDALREAKRRAKEHLKIVDNVPRFYLVTERRAITFKP